jgi:hypothetical protein
VVDSNRRVGTARRRSDRRTNVRPPGEVGGSDLRRPQRRVTREAVLADAHDASRPPADQRPGEQEVARGERRGRQPSSTQNVAPERERLRDPAR